MKIGTYSKSIYQFYLRSDFKNFQLIDLNSNEISCDGLIGGKLNTSLLEKHPNLKFNYIPYTGLNGIDIELALAHNIDVYNSHDHAVNVAEKALMLALSLLGNLILYHTNLMKGDFSNRNNQYRVGWKSLFNMKVGFYGYGHIGKELKKLLEPFNCQFLAYDKYETLTINQVDSLEALVEASEIIFICVPLTQLTTGSINERHLSLMSQKYLVNVARGKVINEEDLYNALQKKTLKGFASDVWFTHPKEKDSISFPSKYPIHDFTNVVMTPHSAAFSDGSKEKVFSNVLSDIELISSGSKLKPLNLNNYR